jgi:hypothetical protein
MRDGMSKSAPMSASTDAGRPVEDAGAEGDSRKQHQEEKKQKKKNISSGYDFRPLLEQEAARRVGSNNLQSLASSPGRLAKAPGDSSFLEFISVR